MYRSTPSPLPISNSPPKLEDVGCEYADQESRAPQNVLPVLGQPQVAHRFTSAIPGRPQTPKGHIVPFTHGELSEIHAAISRPIMRAFVYVLEYTGLRIFDAVELHVQDIVDGRLKITTEKTDEIVWLPLPHLYFRNLPTSGQPNTTSGRLNRS
jgi:integrase